MKISVYKEFTFEAAHHLPLSFEEGHPNWRLHGHSFRVRVWIKSPVDVESGMMMDLGEVLSVLGVIRAELDHRYLNDIAGLEQPTLERIGCWIMDRALESLAGVSAVEVHRDTCNEGCRVEAAS